MAIAVAQSTKAAKTSATGTTQTLAFASNTTTGNTVIVATNYDSGATTAVTGVTVGGVAMTEIGHKAEGGGIIANVALWYLKNITGATTPSVVVTTAGGYIGGMIIAEISGVDTTAPLDGTTITANDVSANATVTGSYTNTNANAILLAVMGTGDSGNTYTATNGGTVMQQQKVGTTVDMALTYKIVSATAANTMSATISNASDWAIVINGLKQAASGTTYTSSQTAALSFSAAFSKSTKYPLSASMSFIGSILKATRRAFNATLSSNGSFTPSHLYTRGLTAAVSFSGSLSRNNQKLLAGALSYTGSVGRYTSKKMTASISFSGNILKGITRLLNAVVSFNSAGGSTITEDSSTPTVVSVTGNTSTLTTASFSPPANSLLVVSIGSAQNFNGATHSLTWTGPGSFTKAAGFDATSNFGNASIWYLQVGSSAPGSVTVSYNSGTGAQNCTSTLSVRVLTGAASGAAAIGATATSTTAWNASMSPSATGNSYVILAASGFNNSDNTTALANTTTLGHSFQSSSGIGATGKLTSLTTAGGGSITPGWSNTPSSSPLFTAVEILPGAVTSQVLTKNVSKALAAGLSFIGALIASFISGGSHYVQALTAALSFTGNTRRSVAKINSANLSFVGSTNRLTSRMYTATLIFVGSVKKQATRAFTAAASFVTSFAASHLIQVVLFASLSFVGVVNRRINRQMVASLPTTGSVTKYISKTFTATSNFSGSFQKNTKRAYSAVAAFIGTFSASHSILVLFTAGLSFTGSVTKRSTKSLTAGLGFTGLFVRMTIKRIAAGLSLAGGFTKSTRYIVSATLSFTGSFLTGSVFKRALTAGVSFTGAMNKRAGKSFTASVAFSTKSVRFILKSLNASVSFVGTLTNNFTGAIVTIFRKILLYFTKQPVISLTLVQPTTTLTFVKPQVITINAVVKPTITLSLVQPATTLQLVKPATPVISITMNSDSLTLN